MAMDTCVTPIDDRFDRHPQIHECTDMSANCFRFHRNRCTHTKYYPILDTKKITAINANIIPAYKLYNR